MVWRRERVNDYPSNNIEYTIGLFDKWPKSPIIYHNESFYFDDHDASLIGEYTKSMSGSIIAGTDWSD